MELIKVNSLKLKIILSKDDTVNLGLENCKSDCEEALSMRSFRRILEKAKEQTGFESGGESLYVQFYPSKDGGGEMYITRRNNFLIEHKKKMFEEKVAIQNGSTYICIFYDFENLLMLCRRLKNDNFCGDSDLYYYNEQYFLTLSGYSDSDFYTYLCEYAKVKIANNIQLAFLNEHASKLCEKSTVETFCEKFNITI